MHAKQPVGSLLDEKCDRSEFRVAFSLSTEFGKRENVWNKIAVYNALLSKLSFAL
jgi:hypothetical protein